ncbi:MAG TPA: M15 family metallopeptidase, partial [Planococcus sp. (in: firmicutes)]|nr:M15 family metallopeptidase [Planococcus sp. (in: firmicutes)]
SGQVIYPAPSTKTPGTYVNGILVVNKKYALPSTYNPGVHAEAQGAVSAMLRDAKAQGLHVTIVSGYRSYSRQAALYNDYVKRFGKKEADRFSARPGHSEHQTGLAYDFGKTTRLTGSFGDTKEGKWLAANAHQYGFILRYPKDKEHITGYMYEPWHFRYLGTQNATKVKNSGKTLEEYLNVKGK